MSDYFVIIIYVIALLAVKDRLALLVAFIPMLVAILLPASLMQTPVLAFAAISLVYAAGAMTLSFIGRNSVAMAMLFMVIYSQVFALDSWINYATETWIYHHHEIIVLCLHAFIVCATSRRFNAMVGCWSDTLALYTCRASGAAGRSDRRKGS